MKIYQNLGINRPEDATLPAGTIGLPYIIESAELFPNAYRDKTVLQMGFKEQGKKLGTVFGYGLIGEEVFKPFMDHMKSDKPEGLVGKVVLAFISPKEERVMGITPRD
jgi:hypothetical protein